MSWVMRKLAHCDACGHEWRPDGEYPKRCGKCKSGRWNSGGVQVEPDVEVAAPKKSVERVEVEESLMSVMRRMEIASDTPAPRKKQPKDGACPACRMFHHGPISTCRLS